MLQTPILLLVFNRPEQALLVFGQIRLQQPERLFIAADGPRADRPEEAALCETTRTAILNGIDWPCKVETLFRTENLGCGKAVSGAINWFFNHVEEGIILEDDCLPDPTFFSFCTAMLEKYRTNEKVMHVNGSNYQGGIPRGDGSYYFSRYAHVWGWASWQRAWQHYDFSLQRYRDVSTEGLNTFLKSELQAIYRAQIDTWDIQWFMSVWFSKGSVVTPNVCLVKNIGFGTHATHTQSAPSWFNKIQYGKITDITHPESNNIDDAADRYSLKMLFSPGRFYMAIKKIAQKNTWFFNLCKRIYKMVS
ncbi:nucleotide-diphospho-sugar transferase [Pedobacter sp. UBA5917]|jgi:hypothetical protein|uniref:nucleotide-diphospho-sugar transferase n=1 Tax=Pedobacter sp. UBA5917 TaxID=1947061 RepID=UPI0025FBC43E|nr:nucleotide-diphospho-sugar transferase [Pedobacter sp. UBA5917]